MQPSLREIQAAFAAYVLGQSRPGPVMQLAGDPRAAAWRLQLYRRHFRLSLVAALAETFSTVSSSPPTACTTGTVP